MFAEENAIVSILIFIHGSVINKELLLLKFMWFRYIYINMHICILMYICTHVKYVYYYVLHLLVYIKYTYIYLYLTTVN